jgi:hypothetical protein
MVLMFFYQKPIADVSWQFTIFKPPLVTDGESAFSNDEVLYNVNVYVPDMSLEPIEVLCKY